MDLYVDKEQSWLALLEHHESTWIDLDRTVQVTSQETSPCMCEVAEVKMEVGFLWSRVRNELMESGCESQRGCYDTVMKSEAPSPSSSFTGRRERGTDEKVVENVHLRVSLELGLISQLNLFIIPIK